MKQKTAEAILDASKATGIAPTLLAAVIHQESSGNSWAVRCEPGFYKKYLEGRSKKRLGGYWPRLCTEESERYLRACSFGPMQLLGQVARERGFKGEFLTELCDPAINIKLGAEFLQTLLQSHGTTEAALLRYNGGGDPNYAKKVLAHINSGVANQHLVR
jgi:soluble lytic murein transglycosylase-like protein